MVHNPLQKQISLSCEMGIAMSTMSHIIHYDLGLRANKHYTHHLLTEKLKEMWCVHFQNMKVIEIKNIMKHKLEMRRVASMWIPHHLTLA